jgi:hypothetical protein
MTTTHGKFHWNELMTRDVEGAKKFYGDTIGWAFEAMPMPMPGGAGTYWVALNNGEPVAGILDISATEFDEVPEIWMAYVAVDDVDARVEKATAAGAGLVKPIFDIPGVGRIAMLVEPGGAGIGWITPAN